MPLLSAHDLGTGAPVLGLFHGFIVDALPAAHIYNPSDDNCHQHDEDDADCNDGIPICEVALSFVEVVAPHTLVACVSSIQFRRVAEVHLWPAACLCVLDAVRNRLVGVPTAAFVTRHAQEGTMLSILTVLGKVGTVGWAIFILVSVRADLLRDTTLQARTRMT